MFPQTEYHIFDPLNSHYDMTIKRLTRLSQKAQDQQTKNKIQDLLEEYRNKNVAIAWASGLPLYFNIVKE